MAAMKQDNYTPIVGSFGVGGPYSRGFGNLDYGDTTQVNYFKKDLERKAAVLSAIVSKILSRPIKTKFVDPALIPKEDQRRFIIDQSGLDLQIYLAQ